MGDEDEQVDELDVVHELDDHELVRIELSAIELTIIERGRE